MTSDTGGHPVRRQRIAVVSENSKFIRRRDDSKQWFRRETGELERNIRWVEVGDDAIFPTEFSAVKPMKNAMSTWDDAQWPAQSRYPLGKVVGKTKGKGNFMLTDGDIVDLCYRERSFWIPGSHKNVTKKDYLCRQLERRAWEKFGGPEGLKKARQLRNDRRARRTATKSAVQKGAQQAPPSLHHQLDAILADSDSGSHESSSQPLTPSPQLSPFPGIPDNSDENSDIELLDNPLEYKSLGFLDLTLSDSESDADKEARPRSKKSTPDIEEIEVIELSD